jgi:hypothetical protein
MSIKLIAIDPWDCGCTECIIGEYKPLCYATDADIADLIAGRLRSNLNTGDELVVSFKTTFESDNGKMIAGNSTVSVDYYNWNGLKRTWDIDAYRAGLLS